MTQIEARLTITLVQNRAINIKIQHKIRRLFESIATFLLGSWNCAVILFFGNQEIIEQIHHSCQLSSTEVH